MGWGPTVVVLTSLHQALRYGRACPHLRGSTVPPMDRALPRLAKPFPANAFPTPTCPTCLDGQLAVQNFEEAHTSSSRRQYEDDERHAPGSANQLDYTGTFIADLRCSMPRCRELLRATGDTFYDVADDGSCYLAARVRTVWPPLPLVDLPVGCPETVGSEIHNASAVVWISTATAVARLRTALERLLDDQGVPSPVKGRPTIHDRIEMLQTSDPRLPEFLSAVKWSGNTAIHEAEGLTFTDVADAASALERVVMALYGTDHVLERAREINRRKVPISQP